MNTHLRRIVISTMIAIAAIAGSSLSGNAQLFRSRTECEAVGRARLQAGMVGWYTCVPVSGTSATDGGMKYPTGISPNEGALIVQSIRNSLKIKGRNIAIAEANINGQRQLLTGVSGRVSPPQTVPSPANRLFTTRDSGAMTRAFDSEVKILEDIAKDLPANAKGTIALYTERKPCARSCREVIQQFKARFPGIKVIVTYSQ